MIITRKASWVKAHANGRNIVGPVMFRPGFVRLHRTTTMLALFGKTVRSMQTNATSQHFCVLLQVFDQQCCVCLHGP